MIDDASDGGLSRGFLVWNSEVGAATFGIMPFHYRHVAEATSSGARRTCARIRIRHVGTTPDKAFGKLRVELRQYADELGSQDKAIIKRADARLDAIECRGQLSCCRLFGSLVGP
ncbi:MAG TPA: hypothetical protein VJH03_14195 [Blastocatellia bacterium]|nr:hypothetical protein [Blastocatellia bacterium]